MDGHEAHHSFMHIEYKKLDYPELLNEIGRLRASVWLAKGGLDPKVVLDGVWLDGHDSTAHHWIGLWGNRLVAASRLHIASTLNELPYAHDWRGYESGIKFPVALISRLVVHPDARSLGVGRSMDELRVEFARKSGALMIVGTAATERRKALESLGFRLLGQLEESANGSGLAGGGLLLAKDLDENTATSAGF